MLSNLPSRAFVLGMVFCALVSRSCWSDGDVEQGRRTSLLEILKDTSDAISIGNYDLALQLAARCIEIAPRESRCRRRQGLVHYKMKNFVASAADLDIAIELEPENYGYFTARGIDKFEMKEYFSAVEDFSKALAIQPSFLEARRWRGFADYNLSHDDKVVGDLTVALAQDDADTEALRIRGLAHQQLGHLDLAIADFLAALKHHGNSMTFYILLGKAYLLKGDTWNADRALGRIGACRDGYCLPRPADNDDALP